MPLKPPRIFRSRCNGLTQRRTSGNSHSSLFTSSLNTAFALKLLQHRGQSTLPRAPPTTCLNMHQSARLTAPVERTFSDRASWRGYLLISITFAAMTIFTLITRGMSPDCHTFARSAATFDPKICNESLVYAGELALIQSMILLNSHFRPNFPTSVATEYHVSGRRVDKNCGADCV